MASPVDLNMAFTQPTSPTTSPAPTLATVSTLTPAHMLGTPYGAMPLSGLLGMKSVPFLTLSSPAPTVAANVAPSHTTIAAYTAKISSANCIKKPERQKFAPYWQESAERQLQCSSREETPDVAIFTWRDAPDFNSTMHQQRELEDTINGLFTIIDNLSLSHKFMDYFHHRLISDIDHFGKNKFTRRTHV